MEDPQIYLRVETDDPTEIERLDEARRLLGADILQIEDVTEIQLVPMEEPPSGVRSGVVWQEAALSIVLGATGYRALTNRTANQLARVLTEFIKRNKGKGVQLEYDGRLLKIEADELSEETVERLSALFTRSPDEPNEPAGADGD